MYQKRPEVHVISAVLAGVSQPVRQRAVFAPWLQ